MGFNIAFDLMQVLQNIDATRQRLHEVASSAGFGNAAATVKGTRVVLDLAVDAVDPASVSKELSLQDLQNQLISIKASIDNARPVTPSALGNAIKVSTVALAKPQPGVSLATGELGLVKRWMEGEIGGLPDFVSFNQVQFDAALVQIEAVCPAYDAASVDHVSLSQSMNNLRVYLERVKTFLRKADYSSRVSEADRQEIAESGGNAGISNLPKQAYPIYFFTVGDGEREKVVYVGIKADETQRFAGGHKAAWGLMRPEYEGMSKRLYLGKVIVQADSNVKDADHVPLEWLKTSQEATEVLKRVESQLIYYYQPELNTIHRASLYKEDVSEEFLFEDIHILQKDLSAMPFRHQIINYKEKK